jgi:hypothetical protein
MEPLAEQLAVAPCNSYPVWHKPIGEAGQHRNENYPELMSLSFWLRTMMNFGHAKFGGAVERGIHSPPLRIKQN